MDLANLVLSNQSFFNVVSPVTDTGDLIIGDGINSTTRLPIGSSGQVLTSDGITASWQTPSSGGGSSLLPMYVGSTSPFDGSNNGEIALDVDKATTYFAYLVSGGPYILNAPSSSSLQFRSGNNYSSNYFSAGGRGVLTLNGTGQLVTDGVLNISGGNAALEYDQNGISEFFVKNTSQGNSAGALIAVEGHNGDTGVQPEGWLFLGGHAATNLNAPHAPDVCELYGRNGVSVRLSTQESYPIDFWTNATQRAIISAAGLVGISNSAPSYLLDVNGDVNTSGVYRVNGTPGVSGSFVSQDGHTITVTSGLITSIA